MAPREIEEIDWTGTSNEMVREIVSRAETYMQAQLQSGIAADQRAITLTGVFVATAVAVAAALVAVVTTATGTVPLAFYVSGSVAIAVLLVAAAFCMWAARPIDFFYPGNQPKNWYSVRTGNIIVALGGEAENYQSRIEQNNKWLAENAQAAFKGMIIGFASPIAALVAWLMASHSC